jgi:hypothetical protein
VSFFRSTSLCSTWLRGGWARRALAPVLAGFVLALSACTFKPHIPDQAISCATDQDCPQGFACNTKLTRCCRPGACDDAPGPAPARPTAETAPPSGNADTHGAPQDGGIDHARAMPTATPATADAGDASDARDARGDGGPGPGTSQNSITQFGKKREDAPVAPAPHLFAQLLPRPI